MKQLTCEMCGGTDLIKQDGVFVCQNCGMKYSAEEAKKMMIEGTVDVQGTVKVDNTAQIQNYLDLSLNAYKSGNGDSAFDYANKALEINPQNSKAWIAKMMSLKYIGTLGSLKLVEVIEAGKNAIKYASEEEKEDIAYEVYSYELKRSLSLLKLAMTKMRDTANINATFKRLCLVSPLTAPKNTLQMDSKIVNIYDNVANEAQAMVLLVPDDFLGRHLDLANLVGECARQYQYETDALVDRYKIYAAKLSDSSKRIRDANKQKMQDKSEKAKKLAKEYEAKVKDEKRAAYWEEHTEKKAAFDVEMTELESELESVKAQIKALDNEKDVLPSKQSFDALNKKIDDLRKQQKSLGLFKGKEKKAIQEEIDRLYPERDNARKVLDADKEEICKRTSPFNTRKREIESRINEIQKELNADR